MPLPYEVFQESGDLFFFLVDPETRDPRGARFIMSDTKDQVLCNDPNGMPLLGENQSVGILLLLSPSAATGGVDTSNAGAYTSLLEVESP